MCQLLALQLPPSSLAQSQQPAFASRSSNLTGDGTDPYVVHVWDRKIPGLPNTKRTATIARSMANGRIFFEATFRCEHTPEHNGSWSRNGCRSRQRPSIVSEKFGVILPPQKKKDGKKKTDSKNVSFFYLNKQEVNSLKIPFTVTGKHIPLAFSAWRSWELKIRNCTWPGRWRPRKMRRLNM